VREGLEGLGGLATSKESLWDLSEAGEMDRDKRPK